MLQSIIDGLLATTPLEAVSVLLGIAYLLLAVRRNRLCWVAGGSSAAIMIYLSAVRGLPMQAALQAYYVGMSVYGFWRWQEQATHSMRPVTTMPAWSHFAAWLAIAAISAVSARGLLMTGANAAWPFLDSLTTWGSLYTTWLVAQMKLENWIYWIGINSLLAFLFAEQGLMLWALLSAAYVVMSVVGFGSWLKAYRVRVPAT